MFYENAYPDVFRLAWVAARDRSAAEEATQEAFARCFARWSRLKDQSWLVGWVAKTAINVVKHTNRDRPMPDATPPSPDLDAVLDIRRAVSLLPPRQQEAVLLHYGMELPLADVAAVMGCEIGTVKAHLAKAREGIRQRIDVESDG